MARYELPPLPYDYAALEPYIDAETMKLHHDKHHQAYINNANGAFEKHPELAKNPGSAGGDASARNLQRRRTARAGTRLLRVGTYSP